MVQDEGSGYSRYWEKRDHRELQSLSNYPEERTVSDLIFVSADDEELGRNLVERLWEPVKKKGLMG